MEATDTVMRAAAVVARKYAKRVFWADAEELRQEAMVAALRARRTWNPEVGVPLFAYAQRACALHLRNFLWKQSAPVSETSHKLANLRDVHRAELSDSLATYDKDAFSLLDEKEWTKEVREQLDYLMDKRGFGELISKVIIDGEAPANVAQEAIDVTELYRLTRLARVRLKENAYLHYLWRNK